MRRKVGARPKRRKVAGIGKVRRRRSGRRRIGAVSMTGTLEMVGGNVIGAVGGRELAIFARNHFGLSQMMSGLVMMGAGYVLPRYLLKSALGEAIGSGLIGQGGLDVLVGTVPGIAGIGYVTNPPLTYRVNGTDGIRTIAGTANIRTINGVADRVQSIPARKQRGLPMTY